MPKDNLPLPSLPVPAKRPGIVPRFLSWLFAPGSGAPRRAVFGTHEELFRIRGELAVLRAALEAVRAEVGRRDIATLDELLRRGNRREIEALIRDRTHTVPLPDGSVLCRVLGRFKMYVDSAEAAIAPHLLLDGYWQYWVTEFICRNVARGERVYDVGAVYGYYTILLADLVGTEGHVVALEGNPWLHWLLARNIRVNGLARHVEARRLVAVEAPQDAITIPAIVTGPADGPFAADFAQAGNRATCTAPAVALEDIEPGSADFIRIGGGTFPDRVVAGLGGLMDRSPGLRILLEFDANRCADAPALLAALAGRYPLRFVDGDACAKPTTVEDVLERQRVTTLYLSRVEPA